MQGVGEGQARIGGIQVAGPVRPPGAAGDLHGAKHRRQAAAVARLHLAVADSLGVADRHHPALGDVVLLAQGTQVQVVLVQPSQHLPAPHLQMLFHLVMGPPTRLGAGQGGDQGLVGGMGGAKGIQALQRGGVAAGVVAGVVGLHRALSCRFGPSIRNLRGRAPSLQLHRSTATSDVSGRRPAPQPRRWHRRTGPARPRPASHAQPAA